MKSFWKMQNGYCMPKTRQSMKKVTELIEKNEPKLGQQIIDNLRIGIHWETEVTDIFHMDRKHRIAQSYIFFLDECCLFCISLQKKKEGSHHFHFIKFFFCFCFLFDF